MPKKPLFIIGLENRLNNPTFPLAAAHATWEIFGELASFGDSPAEACTRAKRSLRSSLASDRAPSQFKASILEVRLNYGCFFPALFSVSQRLALLLR